MRSSSIFFAAMLLASLPALEVDVPPVVAIPEAELSKDAAVSEAAEVQPGIRRYDLRVARVQTRDGERDLEMQLYLPPGEGHHPVVVYVHGGGFIGGDHRISLDGSKHFSPAFRSLVTAGFALASLDYRLAREAGWPAPLRDTRAGIAFLRANSELWNLDTSRIGVVGHSAGARIAALLGLVDDDPWHRGDLPWAAHPATVDAVVLWAGSAHSMPSTDSWRHFAKPRNFSVERLLYGEHPRIGDQALRLLRRRHHDPHLAGRLPALRMIRGANDYRGFHGDAEAAVAIWQALGQEAALEVVPDEGHSAIGSTDERIAFFDRHVRHDQEAVEHDAISAADLLTGAGQPMAALAVLGRTHDPEAAQGDWLLLEHQDAVLWLAQRDDWPAEAQRAGDRAAAALAALEADCARQALQAGRFDRAQRAAANALALSDTPSVHSIATEAQAALTERRAMLQALADSESVELSDLPQWASAGGRDGFGVWADLPLDGQTTIRMRLIEAGSWNLPPHLQWQLTSDDDPITRIDLEHAFWIAEAETTVAQWKALPMGAGHRLSGDRPIAQIGYPAIVAWLDQLEERHPGLVARLPSEAEWLYAAGGPEAWAAVEDHRDDAWAPYGGGAGLPNQRGLRGMLGGVMEWTASPGTSQARFTDETGRFRVIPYPIARGGGYGMADNRLAPAVRSQQRHTNHQDDLGFRLAIGGGPDAAGWYRSIEP